MHLEKIESHELKTWHIQTLQVSFGYITRWVAADGTPAAEDKSEL